MPRVFPRRAVNLDNKTWHALGGCAKHTLMLEMNIVIFIKMFIVSVEPYVCIISDCEEH